VIVEGPFHEGPPLPQGFSKAPEAGEARPIEPVSLARRSLTELSREYALFSHGMYFLGEGISHDPLTELHLAPGTILVIKLPAPAFVGMGSGDFLLYGCPLSEWPRVQLHLGTLAAVDWDRKIWWRGLTQVVPLLDFVDMSRTLQVSAPSYVDVTVFGIDSPKGMLACVPATNPVIDHRLRVRYYVPEEATIRAAQAYFSGHSRPFDAEDPLS
jgi:hypothetical protein